MKLSLVLIVNLNEINRFYFKDLQKQIKMKLTLNFEKKLSRRVILMLMMLMLTHERRKKKANKTNIKFNQKKKGKKRIEKIDIRAKAIDFGSMILLTK